MLEYSDISNNTIDISDSKRFIDAAALDSSEMLDGVLNRYGMIIENAGERFRNPNESQKGAEYTRDMIDSMQDRDERQLIIHLINIAKNDPQAFGDIMAKTNAEAAYYAANAAAAVASALENSDIQNVYARKNNVAGADGKVDWNKVRARLEQKKADEAKQSSPMIEQIAANNQNE